MDAVDVGNMDISTNELHRRLGKPELAGIPASRLVVFLHPFDGMLVCCRVTSIIGSPIPIYSPGRIAAL